MKVPDRRPKLRALGNAVVPGMALVVGRVLIELSAGSPAGVRRDLAGAAE